MLHVQRYIDRKGTHWFYQLWSSFLILYYESFLIPLSQEKQLTDAEDALVIIQQHFEPFEVQSTPPNTVALRTGEKMAVLETVGKGSHYI